MAARAPEPNPAVAEAQADRADTKARFAELRAVLADTNARLDGVLARLKAKVLAAEPPLRLVKK